MIVTGIRSVKLTEECKIPAISQDVFQWPEFLALAKRLGFPLDRPVRRLVLDLQLDFVPTCSLEFLGSDTEASKES